MAILDDDNKTEVLNTAKTIDINDTNLLDGDEQEINVNADAWDSPAPPPDGVYKIKLFLAKQGFQTDKQKDTEELFYIANLVLKIQDEGKWKDTAIFYKVNTLISAGKEISTMAGLIRKTGLEVPSKVTPLALSRTLAKVIKKEAALYVRGEWRAWDMSKGEWIKQGMKQFPKNEDGKGFSHIIKDSKGGSVAAKLKVDKVFGLKEYREQLERESKNKKPAANTNAAANSNKKDEDGFKEVTTTTSNRAATNNDEDLVLDE